jgi:hypothetical protein
MLKNLAYLAAFTTFVVLVWIALTIYNIFNASTINSNVTEQIIPISPNFNTQTIDGLRSRIQIRVDLGQDIATQSAQPTPTISLPTPTQSQSITLPTPTNSIDNTNEISIPEI